LTVAIASLGSRVQNMERQSGYISASAPSLPPARQQALAHEGMQDYVRQKGYDPSILEKKGQYDMIDVESIAGMQGRYASGMTVSMAPDADPDEGEDPLRQHLLPPHGRGVLQARVGDGRQADLSRQGARLI
jgi:hypothetical protein